MTSKRWSMMVDVYGSEEAARHEMRRRAETSKRNKHGVGGFGELTDEKRKEISKRGVEARRATKKVITSEDEADD